MSVSLLLTSVQADGANWSPQIYHNLSTVQSPKRYGSHGFEFSGPTHHAFVPVLRTDTIEMYRDDLTGMLRPMASIPSPWGLDARDERRHIKVHPNGNVLHWSCTHHQVLYVPIF